MKKINFKKITALATSALMIGMTMGVAAAANYPAPFVSGGTADVAIVYGTGSGVSTFDLVEAGNIQTNLQSFMTGTSTGSTSVTGETVSLDSSADRIWLNTSLNSVTPTLTRSSLPTVLKDYTFEGDVSTKLTATISLVTGETTTALVGDEHTGTVIYAKQPKTSNDPVMGISLGTSASAYPLYNASVTMSAINFTSADSEGEEIVLFGQKFTISSDTDTTDLVLLKEAKTVSLSSTTPTATVTIGGADYTVELISASDTAATIQITNSAGVSESKEVSEADSKKINGVQVAVKTADETNLKLSASVIIGADKITITSGSAVKSGDQAENIDGTLAYIKGGTTAATELAIAVFAPRTSDDAIAEGTSFLDPVFGSFKLDFAGVSSPLDDANREIFTVANSGDDTMSLTMTDSKAHTKTFDFAHNASRVASKYKPGNWTLADDSNDSIYSFEMANLSEDDYVILGNEDYGHFVQVIEITNDTSATYGNDKVKLKDVFSGDTYVATITSECNTETTTGYLAACGTIQVGEKSYGVLFQGSGDDGWLQIKYPTSDSANGKTFVVYPTIETKNGAHIAFYEPLNISLNNFNKSGTKTAPNSTTTLRLPDGDGYTDVVFTYWDDGEIIDGAQNDLWNVTTAASNGDSVNGLNTSRPTLDWATITVGQLVYNFTNAAKNVTTLYLTDPETGANLNEPSVVVWEGRDDNSAYNAVVVNLETTPAGTSTDGVGVDDLLYSSDYYHSGDLTLPSDSDISNQIDWWGTLGTKDANDADQKTAILSYPKSQIYTQLYIGTVASAVSSTPGTSGTTQLGNVLVKDSEVSSVATKNLVVVGGSCINSAAATLVGGAKCGSAWTTATGVGAGEFLLKGYATSTLTSKVALLIAGYEAADTVKASTYLRTTTVDTSKSYKGTTSTGVATLVTTA